MEELLNNSWTNRQNSDEVLVNIFDGITEEISEGIGISRRIPEAISVSTFSGISVEISECILGRIFKEMSKKIPGVYGTPGIVYWGIFWKIPGEIL